jgi:hypothetical protein
MQNANPIVFAAVWAALLTLLLGMCWYVTNRDVRQLAGVLFLVVLVGGPSLAVATGASG